MVETHVDDRVFEAIVVQTVSGRETSGWDEVGDQRAMVVRQPEVEEHNLSGLLCAESRGQVDRDHRLSRSALDRVHGYDHAARSPQISVYPLNPDLSRDRPRYGVFRHGP